MKKKQTRYEKYPSPISFPDANTIVIKMNLKNVKSGLTQRVKNLLP